MAAGVGLGYDWLYNELQASTKELAAKALNDFAFSTAINREWSTDFYAAANNWNQVCNGGLVCAALAVYENNPSVAKTIIEKAIESNLPAMQNMYSPDGNYPEGYSYWNYGTIYEALMLTALQTSTGSDAGLSDVEGFSKTGKYMLFMESPLKQCFNYSDSAPSVTPCLPQWYFAWKFNDLSLLAIEKDRLDSYASASESRLLPLVAYYAYKTGLTSLSDIPVPSESIFRGEGLTPVVLIHENWKNDLTDKFLGIKAGKANTSHGHMDAGSFVYDAFGVRWSADLGLQSYATLEPYINLWNMNDGSERWGSFRYNNFNHSTVTVNDAYHKVAGAAVIKGLLNANGQKGA
ncbi:MAG: heparinase II/III family protein, partial [Bacteroidales bacterium]|nr:heparinase II/III family protein [Bacteroidales bacterium]